jgi:zinc-ribbon domain
MSIVRFSCCLDNRQCILLPLGRGGIVFCNYCGAPNPKDASFCSACGKAIVAPSIPPVQKEPLQKKIDQHVSANVEAVRDTSGQAQSHAPLSAPPQGQTQPLPNPSPAGKSRTGLWVLAGFAACLVLVIVVAFSLRQNQTASGSDTSSYIPDSAPVQDSSPAPVDVPPAPAPMQTPPPPPAAPQNPIAGQWKTTTIIGDTILTFTDDGHYTIKSALVGDSGVYVFSSDGTLRSQPDAIFSHDIVIWHCQLSGDSLSVVDPDGAGHVYTRVQQ